MAESSLEVPRCSGVLLHVTSLPGRGIGDLGDAAYHWVDRLADAGQTLWQILPLVPVTEGGSPYNGLSALAGNSLLIDPDQLVAAGLLEAAEVGGEELPGGHVDFAAVIRWKERLLHDAFRAFRGGAAPELRPEWEWFRERHRAWLDDYALFRAVRAAHDGASWVEWEEGIRLRRSDAVARWGERLKWQVEEHAFHQFLFERQWQALRRHADQRGVRIVGDIPIFVSHDSADVWAHRELFSLDPQGLPLLVAGVPPDYFSATGQRWGNPLYRWDAMAAQGYHWWIQRFRRTLEQVDLVRVDHFRGFQAYWEIPAEEATAINGRWVPGPGAALFRAVEGRLGRLPVIAEDLGLITPEVERLRQQLGYPGMRVLQFAFDGEPDNPHLPHNHRIDSVAYTGTHDNATAAEWWQGADEETRAQVTALVGETTDGIGWAMIDAVWRSRAQVAVAPVQDVLGLGAEARMNTPGTTQGNWTWRMESHLLDEGALRRLKAITREAGRIRAPVAEGTKLTLSK